VGFSISFEDPYLLLLIVPALLAVGYLRRPWLPGARGSALGQQRQALALRGLVVVLLVVALSGPSLTAFSNSQAVVFVSDLSASVGQQGREGAAGWVSDALEARPNGDMAAVIGFGERSMIELLPTDMPAFSRFSLLPGENRSQLASALRLAAGLFPEGYSRRIVVLSDGRDTSEGTRDLAQFLAAQGIRIDTVFAGHREGPEVLLARVDAPTRTYTGQSVDAAVTIKSNLNTEARVRVTIDGSLVSDGLVAVTEGSNTFYASLGRLGPGLHVIAAQVTSEDDTEVENNSHYAIVETSGPPTVLLVHSDASTHGDASTQGAANIAAALEGSGVQADTVPASLLPSSLVELAGYQAVFLVDVPATDLRPEDMKRLEAYVKELGGGLTMIGGQDSFGPGGYFGTEVEAALPVDMDVRGKAQMPSLSLMLVVDKSGSMAESSWGYEKMALARRAATLALEALRNGDEIGVVAFDSSPSWVVQRQPIEDQDAIRAAINSIFAGGGTSIFPALQEAYISLKESASSLKHIILLTDGRSSETGDYWSLIGEMDREGITLSTVAIGSGADRMLLQQMALAGGGRHYFTSDALSLPQILTKETILASRSYFVEGRFAPALVSSGQLAAALGGETPPIDGYVAVTPKAASEVILMVGGGDPLLAAWHYGAGRSLAWTSDAAGRWNGPWMAADRATTLWGALLAWLLRQEQGANYDLALTIAEGQGLITLSGPVDAISDGASRPTATVVTPNLTTLQVELRPTAPGVYSGDFDAVEPGPYVASIPALLEQAGAVVPYSPEFAHLGPAVSYLEELASIGGGHLLTSPAAAFSRDLVPTANSQNLTPYLLGLVILLWPLDIANRKLRFSLSPRGPARGLVSAVVRGLDALPVRTSSGPEDEETHGQTRQARQGFPRTDSPLEASPGEGEGEGEGDGKGDDNFTGRLLRRKGRVRR